MMFSMHVAVLKWPLDKSAPFPKWQDIGIRMNIQHLI